jgi:uncharacterized protein (DUF2384 family)
MKLNQKDKLNLILLSLTGSKDLSKRWWKSPNKALDDRTPISLWKGSIDDQATVRRYLLESLVR